MIRVFLQCDSVYDVGSLRRLDVRQEVYAEIGVMLLKLSEGRTLTDQQAKAPPVSIAYGFDPWELTQRLAHRGPPL